MLKNTHMAAMLFAIAELSVTAQTHEPPPTTKVWHLPRGDAVFAEIKPPAPYSLGKDYGKENPLDNLKNMGRQMSLRVFRMLKIPAHSGNDGKGGSTIGNVTLQFRKNNGQLRRGFSLSQPVYRVPLGYPITNRLIEKLPQ